MDVQFRLIVALMGLLVVLPGCVSTRTFVAEDYRDWADEAMPSEQRVLRVFLVGDVGGITPGATDPVLALLRAEAMDAGEQGVVVLLGDNVYCCGLPPEGNHRRATAEARLRTLLDVVKELPGRLVIIPGNHDWNDGRRGGLEAVQRQEAFVEAYLEREDVFIPSGGFPGPVEVKLTDQVRLVAIDTQWWLHRHERAFGEADDYEITEDADFLLEIDDLIRRRDDEDLLVVGHHPIYSNGYHAGNVPLRAHLFPLTDLHPRAVVPAPFIGSLYPLYLRYFGGRQDLPNGRYRELREALDVLFAGHERLIFAAAHDHALQYFEADNGQATQHIVSGSATKPEPVARGRGAAFVSGDRGFAVLDYFADGQVWMEMWTPGEEAAPRVLFRRQLQEPLPERVDKNLPPATASLPDYSDSTVVAAVNPRYNNVGPLRRFFWGNHNRDAWGTPVEMPVLDLGSEKGGLTPLQRGGGMQTLSIRFEGGDGHEYVVRTIDKDPSQSVPVELQGTVATDIVQDQIASIHPYGVFIIPSLAEAAGIYHTRPRLVFVPDDPRLGIYRASFANRVMMLEERPTDDMRDRPNFGRSKEVIGAGKLYREIDADNDHRVDQMAFARVRLFDMWISDWDRHRDQWRWGAFEPYELDSTLAKKDEGGKEGKIYRPIPRDRDFAFNQLDGVFPSLAGLFDNKFQDFDAKYGTIRGLTKNGFQQDRRFTSALSKADWLALADTLKNRLTDEVIEASVREWPEPIFEQYGARTIRLLKLRRDQLPKVAAHMYAMHARVVDVVGSNKHERFEVSRLDDGRTEVVVYKIDGDGKKDRELYRRMFHQDETKEIRLYGLAGDDRFSVEGEANRGITVRAIGGPGEDNFEDESRVRGLGRKTIFYDTVEGNDWETGTETKVVRSRDPAVNRYDPNEYKQNFKTPQVFFGSNKDDGIFIGGGVRLIRYGFRKDPFAATHRIVGNIAARTGAFNVVYQGYFSQAMGKWDAALDLSYLSPDNIRNFYGLGNETEDVIDDRRFYRARLSQATAALVFVRNVAEGAAIRIGPKFQFVKVREDDNFIGQLTPREQIQEGISENTFDDQWYAGGTLGLRLGRADDPVNPKLGFIWDNGADLNAGVRNATDTYATLTSSATFYVSLLRVPQITIATRAGVAHNVGDFPFFGANTLGGKDNLRGYRSTRFAGRTSAYQNAELRLGLFDYSTYLANGRFGVLGFIDNGRVWADGESSDRWHQGYGGGLWTALFDRFVMTGTAGFSEDDRTITIRLGFLY